MKRIAAAILMTAVSSTAFGRSANVVPAFPAGGGAFSGPVCVENNVRLGFGGAGAVCEDDYWIEYDAAGTAWLFRSTDVDGGGADGTLLVVQDGTDDIGFLGNFSGTNAAGPAIRNVASSATVPPINPDQSVPGTGLGGTSNFASLISLDSEIARFDGDASEILLRTNTFTDNGTILVIGHPSAGAALGSTPTLQVRGATDANSTILVERSSATAADESRIILHRSCDITIGTNALCADDDRVGSIIGAVDDDTDVEEIARMFFQIDDLTPAGDAVGGSIGWSTNTVGGTPTTAVLIDSLQDWTYKPDSTTDFNIKSGGGSGNWLATLVTGPPVGTLNGQFNFDIPVSSASADGVTHSFLFAVDSNSIFEVRADSDGAESVDTMGTAFYGTKTGAKVFREFCDVISEVVTFSGGGGEASLDTADEFVVGNYSIAVTGEVLVTGTGCTTFDVGNTIGGPDVDAYGAAIAVTAGTIFDSKNWTATLGYNVLELQGVRLTGNVVTNCVNLSVRLDIKRCIAEVVSP